MSFAHVSTGVKPPHVQPLRGPTFAPWSPADGPGRALWDTLLLVVALVGKAVTTTPAETIIGLRLANGTMLAAWRIFGAWEEDARYQGATTTSAAGVEIEAAREDLVRLGHELRQLERQLVGDPPPTAPPPRTMTVRPRKTGRAGRAAARAS